MNLWDEILTRIETKVNRHSFYTWFRPTTFVAEDQTSVTVRVPNALFKDWLTKHYATVITEATAELRRPQLVVTFIAEAQADAVVRGSITRYEPDLPVAYTGNDSSEVTVTRRQVQITVSVEILDQKQGKPLWQRNGLVVRGDYDSGQELQGRARALEDLVVNIVEGAQSQW